MVLPNKTIALARKTNVFYLGKHGGKLLQSLANLLLWVVASSSHLLGLTLLSLVGSVKWDLSPKGQPLWGQPSGSRSKNDRRCKGRSVE